MAEKNKIQTAMIVDDSEFDQVLYKELIERSGMVDKLIQYYYPDEALEFLKQPDRENVDVLFLDINMPRMSGFEFLKEASQQLGPDFAKIVIIMLTTSLDPRDQKKAKEFEMVKDYINKPLTIDGLKHVISLVHHQS